jgi:hypothetical protein
MKRKEEQSDITALSVSSTEVMNSELVPQRNEIDELKAQIADLKTRFGSEVQVAAPRDLTKKKVDVPAIHDQTLQARRAANNRLIKGVFRDYEIPGGTVELSHGPILKGDVTKNYKLTDGQTYELPVSLIKELNEGCFYVEYAHKPDGQFVAAVNPNWDSNLDIGRKFHRFGFQPVDFGFFTESGPTPNIYLAKAL